MSNKDKGNKSHTGQNAKPSRSNQTNKPASLSGQSPPPPTDEVLKDISEKTNEVQTRLDEGLDSLRQNLQSVNSITTGSVDLLSEFKVIASAIVEDRRHVEIEKAALVVREANLLRAEQARDGGYADERATLDRDLADRRSQALADLERELSGVRATRLAELSREEAAERERARANAEHSRNEWESQRTHQADALRQQADELERQKGALAAIQSELEGRRLELEENERDLEVRSERVHQQLQHRRDNLDAEVSTLIADERESFKVRLQNAVAECDRLRDAIRSQDDLVAGFKHLQQQLGGREPAAVISELKTLNDQISRQREELASRPSEEIREQMKLLERDRQSLQNRVDELTVRLQQNELLAAQSSELKLKNSNLEAENKSLDQRATIFESAANEAVAELTRLRGAYATRAAAEERHREIELPKVPLNKIIPVATDTPSESEWLEWIALSCDSYGLYFEPRILKSFHTALKTFEWSPITVLAGVSGTGKSELPRLYSHFGGLYFEPLSVQPNWDSQESMLGFFNSIDNRFDAQPVLRFLAQSQKSRGKDQDGNEYPGLEDSVCLVLLDEMNLAHPEQYFAEFLSKLELRRGMKRGEVPSLPVKIGAGMEPYQLTLGRNVLWVGTMNQDETTKSLSDKVLDRSIIIYFPRPTSLKRREQLQPLDDSNRADSLPRRTWNSWLVKRSTFKDEDVKPYKEFIEEMNASLAVAGRAIGHRVWQSIEYYMANYPDVRGAESDTSKRKQAMHVAFEDQLVQKVMPKLRGIDTRGKSRDECLDKIRGQLVAGIDGNGFNLAEDFDLAMELGYGQFMWQTANYLKADETN